MEQLPGEEYKEGLVYENARNNRTQRKRSQLRYAKNVVLRHLRESVSNPNTPLGAAAMRARRDRGGWKDSVAA